MSWATKPVAAALPPLVDEFLDSWVCWREACEDVGTAYDRWRLCEPPQRGLAFVSYLAALDREEEAAHMYSVSTERLRTAGHA